MASVPDGNATGIITTSLSRESFLAMRCDLIKPPPHALMQRMLSTVQKSSCNYYMPELYARLQFERYAASFACQRRIRSFMLPGAYRTSDSNDRTKVVTGTHAGIMWFESLPRLPPRNPRRDINPRAKIASPFRGRINGGARFSTTERRR